MAGLRVDEPLPADWNVAPTKEVYAVLERPARDDRPQREDRPQRDDRPQREPRADRGQQGDGVRGNGEDRLSGGEGNDRIEGENGNDLLDGGADRDELKGDNGDDRLLGGAGADKLEGGNGAECRQRITVTLNRSTVRAGTRPRSLSLHTLDRRSGRVRTVPLTKVGDLLQFTVDLDGGAGELFIWG